MRRLLIYFNSAKQRTKEREREEKGERERKKEGRERERERDEGIKREGKKEKEKMSIHLRCFIGVHSLLDFCISNSICKRKKTSKTVLQFLFFICHF